MSAALTATRQRQDGLSYAALDHASKVAANVLVPQSSADGLQEDTSEYFFLQPCA